MNAARFLAMGGYAAYVWPAFGLACAVLLWNAWAARRAHARARAEAQRRLAGLEADA
ncbi:MAG: heme exporter protein CcmD [Gammaproteobacteria bacterium]|nr:heme exporter protein CcmD [Gammaproteobacteria bacterium]